MTWEIDYYSYKKLPDKNSGFKNLEKPGRVETLIKNTIIWIGISEIINKKTFVKLLMVNELNFNILAAILTT